MRLYGSVVRLYRVLPSQVYLTKSSYFASSASRSIVAAAFFWRLGVG